MATVIDADAHINEPVDVFEDYLDDSYRSRRPVLLKDTLGLTRILMEGRLYPEPRLRQAHTEKVEGTKLGGTHPGASDSSYRLSDMDRDGIDVQVMYGSLGLALSTITDVDFGVAMSRACNDYYADFCSVDRSRLKCMATLPVQDVPSAVHEMRRAVTEKGHLGVTLPPNVEGKNLDHPDFYPIYEEAQKLGCPIAVHWGNGSYLRAAGTERFDTHFMVHAVGHPFEQMIALASIVCGGVLEQFPDLRFVFLEAGCGWVPYWVERLEEHYERRAAEMPLMKKEPIEYITGGGCWFSTEPDERWLPAAIATVGDDLILYSSDYPHTDSKFPNSVRAVREREDLSDESKDKVLGANAARFYGLQ
jgi:hypothetical protein